MSSSGPNEHRESEGTKWFPTTHWTLVLAAGELDSDAGLEAREVLCRTYWHPLYAYIRRRGYEAHAAEDLTQEFWARFLAKNHFARIDNRKGRLRSYLLGAVNHFLADARDRVNRLKRGGGQSPLSLEARIGERHYLAEPSHELSPDRLFERRWALGVLDEVLDRLETEYRRNGKKRLFSRIEGFLIADDETDSYREASKELGVSEGALRVAVHRLRRRYGQVVREVIAGTVASPEEIEDEIRHLADVLSN